MERACLFKEVQSIALADPLTSLQDRRSLFELGKIQFARSHHRKRPFSCLILDVNLFKGFTDRNDEDSH
jgi:GGDEF domain-containing protein